MLDAASQFSCPGCGYDRRSSPSQRCPECGFRDASACPSCGAAIRAWTCEDCPGCGRPLDCEADNDQLPPLGALDHLCCECGANLQQCSTLRCPQCEVMRLLRLDFNGDDVSRAERVLQGHGLLIARKRAIDDQRAARRGAIWIRSNCWPSAMWVLEAAHLLPLKPAPLQFAGRCRGCGYDLRGIGSTLCPECGHPIRRATAIQREA